MTPLDPAAPRPPLGHVRGTVLKLPEYDLTILLNGYPAHSAGCRRAWAQRNRIRQPDYDPSDRVRNECLEVVCDCGTDGQYARYLEDQLAALRAQAEAAAEVSWDAAVVRLMRGGNLVLTARGDRWDVAQLLRDAADRIEEGVQEFHDESCQEALWFRAALAQANGDGGEG